MAFCLTDVLTFYLAVFLTFSLACVRAGAPPQPSWRYGLHPELAEEARRRRKELLR